MKLKPYYRIDPKDWMFKTHGDVAAAYARAIGEPDKTEVQIEEYVRQWVLRELIDAYGYPKEWIGERIIIEEVVPVASTDKESDISIKNDRARTFILRRNKSRKRHRWGL
jgi:type I restriction enzyme M protein